MSERVAQIIGDKTRHALFINVFRIAHNVHARKLGQRVARQERLDPRLEPGGWKRERHELHASDALRRDRQSPVRRDVRFSGQEPSFFEQFPASAGLKVDLAVEHVAGSGVPAGK